MLDYGLGSLNGIYTIDLGSSKTEVYCDMTTTVGGWTVGKCDQMFLEKSGCITTLCF